MRKKKHDLFDWPTNFLDPYEGIILTDKPKFMLGVVLSIGKDVKVPLEENTTLMFTPGDIKIVKIGEYKHCCFIVEDAIIGVFDE